MQKEQQIRHREWAAAHTQTSNRNNQNNKSPSQKTSNLSSEHRLPFPSQNEKRHPKTLAKVERKIIASGTCAFE